MHCQGITQYGVHNLLAMVGYFPRVKNNVRYLERQFLGGGQLITNSRCFCIMQDRFFFLFFVCFFSNIRGWAFISGLILG